MTKNDNTRTRNFAVCHRLTQENTWDLETNGDYVLATFDLIKWLFVGKE